MLLSKDKQLAFVLASIILLLASAAVARGQEYVTKSGTLVTPVPHQRALLPPSGFTKNAMASYDAVAGTYVVVTRPDMLTPLQPLLQWKRQQGYRVETMCVTTRNADTIREMLKHRYLAGPLSQKYVLIVGDVDRVAAFDGSYAPSGTGNHVTDLYYGEYTGDYIPEAMVGRLSVADSAQLAAVVAKTIAYEQGRWHNIPNQSLFVAGNESRTPAPVTTNGQVDYLARMTAQHRPWIDTVTFYNPASGNQRDSILSAVEQGNAWINYTAHCTSDGWSSPHVTYSTLDTLTDTMPTLYINNCCLSNAYNITCFGEKLLRRAEGGAVAAIGASNETLWAEDYYWAIGAKRPPELHPQYDATLTGAFDTMLTATTRHGVTIGEMLYAGNRAVMMSGSPFDAFYWEIYSILGDPSLIPNMGRADTLTIEVSDSVEAGITQLTLLCSPNSRLTAVQGDSLLASAVSDDSGRVTLSLTRALLPSILTLTATRGEDRPCIKNISVVPPIGACLSVVGCGLEGDTLTLRVQNTGLSVAVGHSLTIWQDSTDRATGVVLPSPVPAVQLNMASMADTAIAIGIGGYVMGNDHCLAFHLAMTDSNGEAYAPLHVVLPMPDQRPLLTEWYVLLPDSSEAPRIEPGEDYILAARLANKADSVVFDIDGTVQTIYDTSELVYCPMHIGAGAEHVHLIVEPYRGLWRRSYDGWLTTRRTTDRFESGTLDNPLWQNSDYYPWTIDSLNPHSGRYCVRSGVIDHSQKSALTLDIDVLTADSLTFYCSTSSESSDMLYFYIDGRRRGFIGGNKKWEYRSYWLGRGLHRLQWVYQKNASVSLHEDCARIDDLSLPLSLWSHTFGTAESDTTQPIAVASVDNYSEWSVAPNPTSEYVTITLNPSTVSRTIEVYDAYGRRVDTINIAPNEFSAQYFVTHLRLGVYLLSMYQNGYTSSKKLIVIR